MSDPHTPGNRTSSDYTPGEGWLLFAGVMLMLAGVLNFIWASPPSTTLRFSPMRVAT